MTKTKITFKQAEAIELIHNVYVDIDTESYNHDSYDAETGWLPIPENWIITGVKGKDGLYIE